jgi:membrane protein implicated in regulation of membrane protease activity
MAGLEAGGYAHVGTGPVLGPAQFAVLGVLAASIVVAVFAVWRRRASRRSRSDAGTPAVATDPGTPGAATDRGMTGGLARDE